jgi:hypothetical protein
MNEPKRPIGRSAAGGFAIPAAIFVIAVLLLLALSGLYIAQNDATANDGIRRSLKAFYAANAGAAHVIATWDPANYGALNPGDSLDTGWRTLPDGSQYRTIILRVDNGAAAQGAQPGKLYRLRTIGRPGPLATAQRTVVTFARTFSTSDFCCEGAVKIQGRLSVQGTGNVPKADGRDIPPSGWMAQCSGTTEDLPGILVRQSGDLTLAGKPKIYGSPPVLEDASIGDGDFSFYDDLAGMADKVFTGDQHFTGIAPAVAGGTCDTSAPTNWGDPLDPGGACWSYVPIIRVAGNLSLAGNGYGQGILLVDGDLQITGNFDFYGVIVVKGQADLGGTPRVYGGLVVRNGPGGNGLSRLRGNEGIHYSSCVVERALAQASIAQPLSGRHWFEVLN